jgi:asparagine synthase (glutamine-hydrolysing)
MYRYFILIWNAGDLKSCANARAVADRLFHSSAGWTRAFDAAGVAAFHAGLGEGASETLTLDHGAGAVFGRIFNRNAHSPAAALRIQFDSDETASIVQSGGRRLFQQYWGRYVAVVQDAATGETWVLRDPSGTMPCQLVSYQGVHLLFSDFEDCHRLGLLSFSVSWPYIRGMLANPGLQIRATALNEVAEIQLGERLRFSGNSLHRSLEWNPLVIAQTDPIDDPEQAVLELRATTRACIHAWAACYSGIIHNLSGGLDSSIVLSCLKDAPSQPAVTCLNYFGTGPDEDERKYARLMANHTRTQLVEHRLDPREVRLENILKVRRSSRPWYYMYELEHGPLEGRLAAERQANGLFCGSGGDGVFFQAHADLAVADYLFDHGPGGDLLRVAVDAARVSRRSIWPLLLGAVRSWALRPYRNPVTLAGRPKRTLVSQEVQRLAQDESFVNPWFTRSATRRVPPGILWHAATIAVPPAYYNSFGDGPYPERTMPLLSQPLVELCLRIPTYVLIRNGMDRATARRAFAADLPPEIMKRRAKGRIDQHVRNMLDANLDFVRELLLNGRLVADGLLDRKQIELYLTRERSPADFQYAEILQEHLCIEAWLSRWLDDRQQEPAASPEHALPHQVLRI